MISHVISIDIDKRPNLVKSLPLTAAKSLHLKSVLKVHINQLCVNSKLISQVVFGLVNEKTRLTDRKHHIIFITEDIPDIESHNQLKFAN